MIEAHSVKVSDSATPWRVWRESVVFSDDWFGDAQPEDLIVKGGRFAAMPVTGNAWNLSVPYGSPLTNAWGFVRAPWNQNKVPFVTRHNTTYGFELTDVPSCQDHYDEMQETEWSKFGVDIQYNAHGTVHAMIGGVWGADYQRKFEEIGYRTLCAKNVGLEAFATQKNLWRSNQLMCPTYCGDDTPATECKCSCPNLQYWLESGFASGILESESPLFFDEKYTRRSTAPTSPTSTRSSATRSRARPRSTSRSGRRTRRSSASTSGDASTASRTTRGSTTWRARSRSRTSATAGGTTAATCSCGATSSTRTPARTPTTTSGTSSTPRSTTRCRTCTSTSSGATARRRATRSRSSTRATCATTTPSSSTRRAERRRAIAAAPRRRPFPLPLSAFPSTLLLLCLGAR